MTDHDDDLGIQEQSSSTPTKQDEELPKKQQIIQISLLTIAFAFGRTAAFLQVLITPLASHKMVIDGEAPVILSTFPLAFLYYGGTIAAPPASRLMAKVGRRYGFVCGCFLGMMGGMIASYSMYAQYILNSRFMVHFFLLCLGSMFLGFANGFVQFFRFAAAEVSPKKRGLAIAIVLAGGDAAALAGPTIGAVTKNMFSWTYGASYLSLVFLFICCAMVVLGLEIPRTKIAITDGNPRPFWKILCIPRLGLSLFNATIGFSVMVLLMVTIPLVMTEIGFGVEDVSHVLQLHGVGMFAPAPVAGMFIQWFGSRRVMVVGLLLIIFANVIMMWGASYAHFLIGMMLLGMGWNLDFVAGTAMLTEAYKPSEKSSAQAANDFILFFVVSTFSLTSGQILYSLGTWAKVNFLSSCLCIIGLIAMIGVYIWENALKQKEVREDVVEQKHLIE